MGVSRFLINNYVIIVAGYAALLSTLSTIGIIWKIYADRPKIKINTSFGFMNGSKNKGRRPIILSSVGIRCEKKDLINIKTISLPNKLNDGESHTEWFEVEELKNKPCSFAWYRSQTGRLYKSKSIRKKINNHFNSNKGGKMKNGK